MTMTIATVPSWPVMIIMVRRAMMWIATIMMMFYSI